MTNPKDKISGQRLADIPDTSFSSLDKCLLNDFQKEFPLTPTPFHDIADKLSVSADTVMDRLRTLQDEGVISRIGPVFRPNCIGTSMLAAMEVPEEKIEEVAQVVNSFPEVNHNYEREHRFNLWFVVTSHDEAGLEEAITRIESATGHRALRLPMLDNFHIDLGFDLQWN